MSASNNGLDILSPTEMLSIRIKLGVCHEAADALFGLRQGSYYLFECGHRLPNSVEDYLIRSTAICDRFGHSLLRQYIDKFHHNQIC